MEALVCVGLVFLMMAIVMVGTFVGMWKVFEKAGQPGWAGIVPIYQTYVMVVDIAKMDVMWFILSIFVPFAGIVPMIEVAKKFGKDTLYGLGLAFLPFIFWPMLGFSAAEYQGRRRPVARREQEW